MSFDSSIRANAWKWLVLLAVAIFSICVTTPLGEKIRLGLDLKGGTSFTLGVDMDALRESAMAHVENTNDTAAIQAKVDEALAGCDERVIEVVRRRVDGMGMNEPVIQGMKGHRILVQLPGVDETNEVAVARTAEGTNVVKRLSPREEAKRSQTGWRRRATPSIRLSTMAS